MRIIQEGPSLHLLSCLVTSIRDAVFMGVASLVYEFFIYLVRDVIVEYRCFDHPGTVSKMARDSEVLIFLVLFREGKEEVV